MHPRGASTCFSPKSSRGQQSHHCKSIKTCSGCSGSTCRESYAPTFSPAVLISLSCRPLFVLRTVSTYRAAVLLLLVQRHSSRSSDGTTAIMDMRKDDHIVSQDVPSDQYLEQYDDKDDNIDPSVPKRYRGTAIDKRDMRVLGKTQVLRVRLFVNYAHHQTDCLCSATSSSSPCWALPLPSWPVGKSCCRKDTPPICISRLTHVTDCLLSSSSMVVPHCSFGA